MSTSHPSGVPESVLSVPLSAEKLHEIRQSWSDLHKTRIRSRRSAKQELCAYFNCTVFDVLNALTNLEEAAQRKRSETGFNRAFLRAKPKIVRELKILSQLSNLLFPLSDDVDVPKQ